MVGNGTGSGHPRAPWDRGEDTERGLVVWAFCVSERAVVVSLCQGHRKVRVWDPPSLLTMAPGGGQRTILLGECMSSLRIPKCKLSGTVDLLTQ